MTSQTSTQHSYGKGRAALNASRIRHCDVAACRAGDSCRLWCQQRLYRRLCRRRPCSCAACCRCCIPRCQGCGQFDGILLLHRARRCQQLANLAFQTRHCKVGGKPWRCYFKSASVPSEGRARRERTRKGVVGIAGWCGLVGFCSPAPPPRLPTRAALLRHVSRQRVTLRLDGIQLLHIFLPAAGRGRAAGRRE